MSHINFNTVPARLTTLLNSSVNFKFYRVIGNLTMIKTNGCFVSHAQRSIDHRFELCKKRKY
jgi:hypothetical protein